MGWYVFWMEYGIDHKHTEETYVWYEANVSDAVVASDAEDWATDDMSGWRHEQFRWGYSAVGYPTRAWAEKRLVMIQSELDRLNAEKVRLAALGV